MKPNPKVHVVSMTSDGEDGAETNKNINIEGSGTSVSNTIEEDSSGSAMVNNRRKRTYHFPISQNQTLKDGPYH